MTVLTIRKLQVYLGSFPKNIRVMESEQQQQQQQCLGSMDTMWRTQREMKNFPHFEARSISERNKGFRRVYILHENIVKLCIQIYLHPSELQILIPKIDYLWTLSNGQTCLRLLSVMKDPQFTRFYLSIRHSHHSFSLFLSLKELAFLPKILESKRKAVPRFLFPLSDDSARDYNVKLSRQTETTGIRNDKVNCYLQSLWSTPANRRK